MRQMNLQFSIGDLVIVEADSSSTGWAKFLDEVQGWGVTGPGFQDRLQWFYWQVQGKCEDIAKYSSHHDDLNAVFDPKYIPLPFPLGPDLPGWNNENCLIKDVAKVRDMVNADPSKNIEGAWTPPSKQVRLGK